MTMTSKVWKAQESGGSRWTRCGGVAAATVSAALLCPIWAGVAAAEEGPAEFRDGFNYALGQASIETIEQIGGEEAKFQGAAVEMIAIVTNAGIVLFTVGNVEEVVFDLPTNQESQLLRGQVVFPKYDINTKSFKTIDIADDDAPEQTVILTTASPGTGRDCSRGGQQCRQGTGG